MATTRLQLVTRKDMLPEHSVYHDKGCDVAPACLACPLPVCKYDDPGWRERPTLKERSDTILSLLAEGLLPNEIAPRVGCSIRTVHRAIKKGPLDDYADDAPPLVPLPLLAKTRTIKARRPLPKLRLSRG